MREMMPDFPAQQGGGNKPVATPMTPEQRAALMAAADGVAMIAEVVLSYRSRLVNGGVAPAAADVMSKDLQDMLLKQMSK